MCGMCGVCVCCKCVYASQTKYDSGFLAMQQCIYMYVNAQNQYVHIRVLQECTVTCNKRNGTIMFSSVVHCTRSLKDQSSSPPSGHWRQTGINNRLRSWPHRDKVVSWCIQYVAKKSLRSYPKTSFSFAKGSWSEDFVVSWLLNSSGRPSRTASQSYPKRANF